MFHVRVIPQRSRSGQTRDGVPASTARTIEVATALVADPKVHVSSVRLAHLSLDDTLAAVVREIASRPEVRLVLRPCVGGAYVMIEPANATPNETDTRRPGATWLGRILGWADGDNR